MFRLGSWSMALLVLATQILLLAAMLWRAGGNRLANITLALLMVVSAGLMAPFILGYAGAYDAWPWLSFAPFAVPLAIGPLVYAHITALAEGRRLSRWHWAPPVCQFAWQAALFPWPTETKSLVDERIIGPFVSPATDLAIVISMAGYGLASWRTLRRYRAWLSNQRRIDRPARRINSVIIALIPLIAVKASYSIFDVSVRRINYFDQFGYYLLLGALTLWIGVAGWKAASDPSPIFRDENAYWAERGRAWIARCEQESWWRDPDLTLEALALKLGTNSSHLSRALAPFGGFAAVLGNQRAEAVAERLASDERNSLLAIALDCGFGSKASFNRAFKARFGVSPREFRNGA